jgi:hypothetical protein
MVYHKCRSGGYLPNDLHKMEQILNNFQASYAGSIPVTRSNNKFKINHVETLPINCPE